MSNVPATKPLTPGSPDEELARGLSLRGAAATMVARVRAGQLGSLPIVVGLVLIWGILQSLNSAFLSSRDLVNLATEMVPVGVIAIGIVLVLLVAEIDLSVGSMSGVASSILGVGLTSRGWSLPVSIVVALAVGVVVGLVYGFAYVRFRVPSFVITLAGLLALLGLQLHILGTGGSINLPFQSGIVQFMQNDFLPPLAAYALAAACSVAFFGSRLGLARRRRRHGLPARGVLAIAVSALVLLVALEAVAWYLNRARGVSMPFVLFVALVIVVDWALKRTKWGRGVYAVGGSVEAARRAGIRVSLTYLSVFVGCSFLAALGGLLAAGRLSAASISSGTGDVNLNAIAAAVIGGTSLFGGRGSAYSALLGILVIESISNGLTLLNLTSAARFMITGLVLFIAVVVDSLAKRSRALHGAA